MRVYKSINAKNHILDTYDQLLCMWGVDIDEKNITTTYGDTHVIACGDESSPPLVLFHGVGDNSALMWLYNAKALSHHFMVYAVDTIGGPGKSVPNENYNKSFDDAQWIDEVLRGLNIEKTYMAGVSNGAYLAQYYCLHRPDRVIKVLCMAGSVPTADINPMKTMLKVFLPEALFPTKRNVNKLIYKLCGKNSAAFTDQPVVLEHYQALLKGFNNTAMRFHNVDGYDDAQISAIRGKTLYLVGESDPFALMGGKDNLIRHKMNVRFFPDVGHGINHEISDAINNLIPAYFLKNEAKLPHALY